MNKKEQMELYDNPQFWSRVIKEAKKQATPVQVKKVYRPVGFWIVLSFLVLAELLDNQVPFGLAVLLTMLVSLLMIIFS